MKQNIYEMVTEMVVKKLEEGVAPWHMPWSCIGTEDGFISASTHRSYSFLNIMLLMVQGGTHGEYLTFNQVHAKGGKINKGAKSKIVVFYTVVENKKKKDDGTEFIDKYPVLKYYKVFHISDTNLEQKKAEIPAPNIENNKDADEVIDQYVKRSGIKFQNDKLSSQAYFSPSKDIVVVPMISQYKAQSEYYSTAFHELTHSTGVLKRLNRGLESNAAFGSKTYSREELVAEMGSAMCLRMLGMDVQSTFNNSVAYIKGWIDTLKSDSKAIIWAASRAERAARYIFGESIEQDNNNNND